jgi:hypothetical protein
MEPGRELRHVLVREQRLQAGSIALMAGRGRQHDHNGLVAEFVQGELHELAVVFGKGEFGVVLKVSRKGGPTSTY